METLATRRIAERFSRLTPEQRRTVYQKIRAEGLTLGQFPILARDASSLDHCHLSYAQLRQWFLWQLDPSSTAYHISGALKLEGRLDVDAVRASFDALVQRHESLRTTFRAQAGGLAEQVIHESVALDVAVIDLGAIAGDDARETRLREEAHRLSDTPFDLTTGPLLRVGLIRLAPEEHMLVVVMHHIVSDGWSMQIIVDEFVAQYRARVQGAPEDADLQPLPVQYADYAVWQRNWLEAGERERQLSYWTSHVGTDQPVLQLPADHARRADGRYSAARHAFELPDSLVKGLQKRAQGQGATLFMTLLAGFQVLLNRYTGLPDIRVGVPIANRHRVETEGVVGFFVNTQVLRSELDGRESLAQVLLRAKDAALGAQAHQDLPFEQLVEALQPERSLSTSPLFQVMFNHQRGDFKALDSLPGLTMTEYDLGTQAAQFELTLDTSEDADGRVRVSFKYAAELFEPQTIERMAGHYQALLEALAERPEQSVGDVKLLGSAELLQLQQWGSQHQQGEASVGDPIHSRIERHAAQHPDAPALVFGAETLSYGELNARANRLAHRLISLGVKPESRVGIAVERSIAMVVGILAVLKAGGAYVPLDPDYPADRLAYMVQDSGIALLLTQSHLGALPGAESLQVLALDTLDTSAEPDSNPQVALHGENLAYVIYTSGSTGRPKGAQLCHRNVTRLLDATQHWFGFSQDDVWTMFHSYAFDFSVWEIFGALCTGGKLVVVPFWVSRSPEDFLQLLREQRVSILNQTPSAFGQLVALPQALEGGLALRAVIFGGEALDPQRLKPWIERYGDDSPQLINMYGITETTVHVTYRRITQADLGQQRSPVGVAIPDLGMRVLDGQLEPVPVGVAGELYVSGEGLARGYLKRAGLTAERFIATDKGQRLYRTGDLVRWNNEGQLEYLGRIDHQVKVRGFRIELGEIEAGLQAQAEVREAVVVANEGPAGTRLVGYVSGNGIDTTKLRERLSEALPDYMVPSVLVVLEALPLNANGKVDRKALPAPEFTSDRAYEAPRGDVEQTLASIWAEVLGVARVGRNDNFFELGGHSLLALRLLESVRERGWSVQVRTLFQHPQLGAFAQALLQEQGRVEVVVPPNRIPEDCEAIQPDMLTLIELDEAQINRIEAKVAGGASNIQDIYPLAPLQEGMLFHHLLQTEGDAYITSHALGFDSRQRLERFVQSFNRVIERHDILRTAVLWEGLKEPVQVVQRQAELKLQWLEENQASASSIVERLEARVSPAHYRIDVQQAPMIHAIAAHDPQQGRWLLQLPSHHMVLDHTTLDFLVQEIALIQQDRFEELPVPVPFRNYVAQARLGVSQAEHEAFFRQMLGDVDEPTAPFNLLDVQGDGTRVEEARLRLDPELARQIRREAQRHGVSAATLFHLAWALVLGKATGKDDVVFGTVLFGRMQGGEGAQRALGLFINTLPLRVRLGAKGVLACVKETHEALTQLLHHEHANLSLAQRCSALPGGTPLFSALLNYRHGAAVAAGEPVRPWEGMEVLSAEERTNYPFVMSVDDLGDGFALVAQIVESVDAQRICNFMHMAIGGLVHALAQQPAQAIRELEVVSQAERSQLQAWSENGERHEGTQPVHYLIERQAKQHPDATALVFGEETLSYGELNARANRLAHHLMAQGVGPEVLVGIAVERSVEMVVGILGIVKAGGAYVPLDPEYPADRLAYMVEDSGIGMLLTQSHLRSLIAGAEALQILDLDTLDLSGELDSNPEVDLHGEHLAYVIYTSGSTGRPKGAANRHRSLHNRLAWMQQAYELGATDTVLQKTPFSFDVSVWEFFWPLMHGAKLVVANPGDHRDPARLVELIGDHQVNTLHFVPSMLQAFLAYEGARTCTSLKRIVCSGEALPAEARDKVFSRLPQAKLYNLYGPTEAAIDVTHWTCRDDGSSQVPIGRPISQTQAYVLDGSLNEAPAGVAGELYLGGINLARGYLKRAGLTAERFIATDNGSRLYRTGDLVRWNNEGQLEYLGRIDHQVKVRGFRIELGEIEAGLQAQPEVREAVVVANEGPAGTRLVGYVSAHAGQIIDTAVLKQKLGEALPDYMVPSVLVVLEALPLNANGKVDRKALPAPEFTSDRAYEAPEGEVEETLAAIWAEVLGVSRVGRNDNFFELGGHSLLALRLLESVRERGWSVQVRTLFQHPQLGAFAQALLQEQGRVEVVVPENRIPQGCEAIRPEMLTLIELDEAQISRIEAKVSGGALNIQDIYPLAPLQEGMLFHHLLQTEGDAYITSHALGFDSRQRLERFVQSFNRVIERHDILRTAVLWEGLKEPVQVVQRHAELKLQWLEEDQASALSIAERLEARVSPAHYRIDVQQAPMIHAIAAHDPAQDRWLLQLPSHHMVLDHTTLDFLVQEIALIQQDRFDELPAPVPFRNYVAQARLGVSQAEHEAFFTQMLGDVDEPTAPFNLLDVQGDGTRVEEARLRLEPELAQQIRREAQRHGVSAATLFHLAWALVLGKATGKDDVVFGTVLFGRMQGGEGAQRALGLFINTLPLRVRLGAKGVLACVKETHEALTQLLHHEHANLSLAQRCSALPGGTPLFSALLNYRYTPEEEQTQEQVAPDLAWAGIDTLGGAERSNYPFGMSVDDLGKGFELVAQVHDSVDAQRVCGYMLAAVQGVVTALVQWPQQPACEIGIVSAQEMQQLAAWSENARCHVDAQPVHRQIEAHARLKPQAPALAFGDEALSYGELNARANRLAHRLISLGVGPDVLVGLCVERSVEMMVGILAVLKAGGAYVPLDPEYPAERLAYMVEDSGIALLLTQRSLRSLIPGVQTLEVLELDTLDTSFESDADPQVPLHGEHLAYVIYTSGSTGRPKGAAIRHAALFSCMAWMQEFYTLAGADTVLHKAPFGFDVSVWEMFWPLTSGARLVIANPGDHRDPVRLVELIRKHQITTLNFVPSMLQAFLAYEGIEETTNLKHIICGGEAMPAATQREALQRLNGATLQNLYGPTETTIHVTQWTCRDDGSSQVPIGRPISDTQAYVLDGSLNEVPAGVAGELYLGGINLARGYLKRAGLTAERFIATEKGQRLYRTGDLVRWNNEGQLEYLGRIDHQVKVRGFRIELGEIEAGLQAQPEVREAVVVANEGLAGTRLVAYVSGNGIDTAVLRARLAEALPDYMVPSVLVVLEALPLNANGKVDRKALPAPEFTSDRAYEAPEGEVEQTLASIWAEVLGVTRVGRNDNFFELGGHSLLALRLLESVRERGWSVQVRTLFQHPQLASFAQALLQEQGRVEVVVPPNRIPEDCEAIEPDMLTLIELDEAQIGRIEAKVAGGASNIQDIYPLAPLQEGMLFHHLLQTEGDAYITSHALGFDSRQRLERFVQSFNRVIERHDILRTAVLWEGLKEPVQVVQRHAELKLQWLEEDNASNAADRLQAHVDPAHYRIDVQRAPMIHAIAAHDPQQGRWLLQLPSHHMVLDHTTLDFLVQEIALIQQDRFDELPAPVPFRNYVAQARLGVSQAEHEAFFRQMLGDVDEPTAPFNLLDVQGDGTRVEEARLRLDPELAQQIRREAQRHGVSAATLFHLAWALVLGKATGKDDVVFGTVLFGRMQGGEGAQRALGLFINTLPLRVRLGAREVQTCVKETHAALTQLLHHEHANLSLAQRCSALPGGTPLFSALLNYRYSPEPEVVEGQDAVPMWEGMDDLGGQERTNYPFGMSVDDLGKDFELVAQIHEAVSAQRICGFMRMAIEGIVTALETHPAQSIRELDVISDAERSQLAAWGSQHQQGEASIGDPIHSRMERHAAQHPDAIALVFGNETLSYGELNARANRLAHRLIALGVKPESRVGIAVERSSAMVVGILAILKAGGAYVPLDPDYPADRLAYMVQDSGIALLLTQSHLGALPGAESLQVLALDTLDTSAEPDSNPQVALHGENLAYVIYTSGSTGRPKGAQLCHRNVTRLLDATQHWFGFSQDDVWTMFHSYAFDFSVWEIFGALCTGGKLVVVPFWVSRSPEDFLQLLREQRVSILNQTPSAFGQLVALPQALEGGLALRAVIFGGEALDPQRLRPWIERYGDDSPQLINMYGITETTVHVTYRRITQADLGQQRSPVGVAIPDLGMRVLDGQLEPVPVGVAGELYVSGEGLARGYLKRAGLTAERFIATEKGQRLYRTGDLVRWNNEGQLEYLGRIDHQVKVRGFRIELGEIEAGLQAQSEVREAVVVANEGPAGTRLVGYVSGNGIDTAVLKQKLGEALPDYMVPSVLVVLEALPLNANGKVDRKALPAPEFTSDRAYEAPEGEVEQTLASIWAEVLGVTRVGRNDNFFELGGDSIISLKLIARIRDGVPGGSWLSLIDVMQSGSLKDLAARRRQKFEQEHNAVCFNATGSGTPLYCLPGLMVNSREFLPLAQALQDDRPVYGFACHVFTRNRWRGFDVQAIAAEYADFIEATALHGRCALLGWSSGGDLAFEVVRQLQGRVEIEFVGMVDVFENTALQATRTLTDAQCRQAEEALAAWLSRSQMADRWHELLARMSGAERAYVLEEMLFAGREFPLDGPGEESLECEMWIRIDKRLRAQQYAYDRIDVPMHVFLADASLKERGVLRNWSDSAPVLSTEIVPDADHLSIIRHPRMLASLRQHLAQMEVPA